MSTEDVVDNPAPGAPPAGATALERRTDHPPRRGPSPLTIVWGMLLLACAGIAAGYAFLNFTVDPVLLGALVVAGCGLILLLAAAFGARRSCPQTEEVPPGS